MLLKLMKDCMPSKVNNIAGWTKIQRLE